MKEKEHVALSVCPICGTETGVLLSTRFQGNELAKIFDQSKYVDPTGVCSDCREKYLTAGVLIIDPATCSLAVITDEAFKRMFNVPIPADKIAFMKEDLMKHIGLLQDPEKKKED